MRLHKNPYAVPLLLLLASACKKATTETSGPPPAPPAPPPSNLSYQLVWSDEFDSTAINTANWNFETGGNGWGNNEQQFYKAANAAVADGNLVITAKKEATGSNAYTSARLTTAEKREFTYGKIEARMKLPVGQGLWPAFWALGANIKTVNWPACGEIDIMEHINTEDKVYGTMHWNNNGHAMYGDNTATTPADYHVYAIEWDAAAIRWYVDSTKFHEADIAYGINGTSAFGNPFFLILNLAVGGNWPGQTVDETKLPARLYVDYVRVYQKK